MNGWMDGFDWIGACLSEDCFVMSGRSTADGVELKMPLSSVLGRGGYQGWLMLLLLLLLLDNVLLGLVG